jgi:hypothetical protein
MCRRICLKCVRNYEHLSNDICMVSSTLPGLKNSKCVQNIHVECYEYFKNITYYIYEVIR